MLEYALQLWFALHAQTSGDKKQKIRVKAPIFRGITTAGPETLELFLDLNRKMGDLVHRPVLIHKSIHKALRVSLGVPYWWDGALGCRPGVGTSLLTVYGACGSFANSVVRGATFFWVRYGNGTFRWFLLVLVLFMSVASPSSIEGILNNDDFVFHQQG